MWDFVRNPLADNTAQDWLVAAVVVVVMIVLVRTVIGIGLRRMKVIAAKTETDVDDLVAQLLEKTKFLFVALVALYAGALSLNLPPEVDDLLSTLLVLGFLIQGAFWANGVVNYMLGSWARQKFEADPTISTALGSVGFLIRFAVWATFVMLALDNLGIDVGPLVASLGIGGVALALALQGVLGDLFASLSIIFDKPFVVGDSIKVGDPGGDRSARRPQEYANPGPHWGAARVLQRRSSQQPDSEFTTQAGTPLRIHPGRDLRHALREARANPGPDSGDHRVAREYALRTVPFHGLRRLGAQLRDGV